jgi:hypothetical protein
VSKISHVTFIIRNSKIRFSSQKLFKYNGDLDRIWVYWIVNLNNCFITLHEESYLEIIKTVLLWNLKEHHFLQKSAISPYPQSVEFMWHLHTQFFKYVLIFSCQICPSLPSSPFFSSFLTKMLYIWSNEDWLQSGVH